MVSLQQLPNLFNFSITYGQFLFGGSGGHTCRDAPCPGGFPQHISDRGNDGIMDPSLFPEADLVFGRMDIDVDITGPNFYEQHNNGIASTLKQASVSLKYGMLHNPVPDETAIYVGIEMRRRGSAAIRFGSKPGYVGASTVKSQREEVGSQ